MSIRVQTQVKAAQLQKASLIPAHTSLLQRKYSTKGVACLDNQVPESGKKPLVPQRRATDQSDIDTVPPIVPEALHSPGQPLDTDIRAFMEPRFGHDFSQVRVHTDAKATESARAVNALAYTVGRDVVFGGGQYAPETAEGKKLIAHELTHVVQQGVCQENATGQTAVLVSRQDKDEVIQLQAVSEETKAPMGEAGTLAISLQEGDIVVRAGTFSGKNPLVQIIGEPYNHGGVAISGTTVHHVEANGYETVTAETFFHPDNAAGGAILRFQGPFASEIRARVVDIAKSQRYVRIPGNPFSTAENLKTVNCNEFIHELFRQAIAELMAKAQGNDPQMFPQFLAEYGDPHQADQVKKLIETKTIRFQTGGITTGLAVAAAEFAGEYSLKEEAKKRGEVVTEFEGKLEMRNAYPAEWARSWNPIKAYMYSEGFYTVAVLRTYTPDSFINSKYFSLIRRVKAGEK